MSSAVIGKVPDYSPKLFIEWFERSYIVFLIVFSLVRVMMLLWLPPKPLNFSNKTADLLRLFLSLLSYIPSIF